MWLRQRQSPFEDLHLPRKLFISHSYKDAQARERLLKQLPKGVDPFIFPPITVPPEQMVSDKLLNAIRACDGLIYLEGGASAWSFWVALERDYALRLGKPVYAFDPGTGRLVRDASAPLTLKVFISYSRQDRDAARRIVELMRQRYVDAWLDENELNAGVQWADEIFGGMEGALAAGGYVVSLWSESAQASRWVAYELQQSERTYPGRVLVALLDESRPPLPFVSLKDGWVQLKGDAARSQTQRVDDLIVRLYWMIYQNTRQNQLG